MNIFNLFRVDTRTQTLRLKLAAFAVILLFSGSLSAQNIDQNWIFGFGGGYDWNNMQIITNSQMASYEGCASISDAGGNLIFYTDGINAWDANHNLVTTGFDMMGDPSSTQSGVIIPKPGTNDYYILAVDFMGTTAGYQSPMGYYTANIDINGNLTSVTPASGTTLIANSSEKIAAVRKPCDPNSIWVIGHNFTAGQYEVFEATNSGIVATGTVLPDQFSSTLDNRKVGSLRFNHDGTVLASAVYNSHVELMGFDPVTGQFTGTPINFDVQGGGFTDKAVYGLEFSPDNNTLYLTITGSLSLGAHTLWQYDVSNMSQTAIEASRTLLANYGAGPDHFEPSQLQLAPDGSIYVALWPVGTPAGFPNGVAYLGEIANPNVGGVANYNPTAIAGPANSPDWVGRGLPTFLTETFSAAAAPVQVCEGGSVQLQAGAGTNYNWTPATGLSCTTCPNPMATPTADITYAVQYIDGNGDCQIVTHPVDVVNCNTDCENLGLAANFSFLTTSSQLDVQDLSTVSGATSLSYIEWNFDDGDGWEAATPGTPATHFYSIEGTYNVCLHAAVFISADECCHDTICQTITVLFDTCSSYVADFTAVQGTGSLTMTFQDVTQPWSDISIWDLGDGTTTTTSGTSHGAFTHTYAAPGDYDVTLVTIDHINDTLCCIDSVTRRITVVSPNALRIAPTVVDEELQVEVLVDQPDTYQLVITNSEGHQVFELPLSRNGVIRLEHLELAPGIYFLELRGGETRYVKRFAKM